jgi:hypothetical protein
MTAVNRKAVLPIALFLIALATRLIPGPRTVDDAFITFRYARNILAGNGFVFNAGERVLGTTTPIYTVVMAALGSVTGGAEAPFPEIAMVLNAVADGIACILIWSIGRRLGFRYASVGAALVWAIAPFSVTFAIGGLETSVFVSLLCALALSYLSGRYALAGFLASLAILTRPDALLLVVPLALDRTIAAIRHRSPKPGMGEFAAFIGPLAAWGLFAAIYFGNPVPHSLAAKSLAYQLPETAAFARLVQHYTTPFMEHLTFGNGWIAAGLVIAPFLNLAGFFKAKRSDPRCWPIFAYPWIYLAAFSFANPLIFRWYLTPPLPFYILGILIGAEGILQRLGNWIAARETASVSPTARSLLGNSLLISLVVIPVGLSLRGWSVKPDHGVARPAPEMAWYQLELEYRAAADFLDPLLDEQTVLAASDVGVLGYFTSSHILDTVGLNSPIALQYYPVDPDFYVINLATSPDLIMETRPDFIVLLEVYGREGVFKDERFQRSYTLIHTIPTDVYGSDGMLIFSRNDRAQDLKGNSNLWVQSPDGPPVP